MIIPLNAVSEERGIENWLADEQNSTHFQGYERLMI
jgi:hypothetical protein